ncbi:hypothetical protein ZOSMA_51G00370 [Zostera marina]|uniref:aldehyde oxygenase (deformylating) n=1 Tax=Zostera marina TaxID=29655 RepID=A0A0K9NXN4_ZOSMR|nr:hypothetical protein ZOSMA_51G00370 [Zostera marina]
MEYINHPFVDEASSYNNFVLGNSIPSFLWKDLPHPAQTWLRSWVAGTILYFLSSFVSYLSIRFLVHRGRLAKDTLPPNKAMIVQMLVAMKALPMYSVLPALSEFLVEKGWTRCYSSINEVGWPLYFVHVAAYLMVCEIGVYWTHRKLHEVKPLYKYIHAVHHIHNKENTASPFAGLAFNPVDGIVQALPHLLAIFLVPTQFATHIALLLLEGLWTANIHDCVNGKSWPILGAGYHIEHHKTYRHNYGHYTVFMDWICGTLRNPEDDIKKGK